MPHGRGHFTFRMTSAAIEYFPPFADYSSSSRSAGDVGRLVQKEFFTAFCAMRSSTALWGDIHSAESELQSIYLKCSNPDWDGEGAAPVSEATFQQAWKFLLSHPAGLPAPSLCAEHDGRISFDWFGRVGGRVTASVGESSSIPYAAILGPGRVKHGVEQFTGYRIPDDIRDSVRKLA